jgi:molybdenum cofactor biosynthesis protein B
VSKSVRKHRSEAPQKLRFAVFTVSTSRYAKFKKGEVFDDVSGDQLEDMIEKAGYSVGFRTVVSDDKKMIEDSTCKALCDKSLDVLILSGGTGVTATDVTIESVSPFFAKVLPGFGEIFRRLSYDELGSAAVLSRAVAGIAQKKVVFCIPGSPDAVQLCTERLILPEVGHILKHARE